MINSPLIYSGPLGALAVERAGQEVAIERMLDEWNKGFTGGDILLKKMKVSKIDKLVDGWLTLDAQMQDSVKKAEAVTVQKLEQEASERKVKTEGKEKNEDKTPKSCWTGKKVTRLAFGLTLAASLLAGGAAIVQTIENNNNPCPVPLVPLVLAIIAIAVGIFPPIISACQTPAKEAEDAEKEAKDKEEQKDRDKQIREAIVAHDQRILTAIQEHDKQKEYEMFRAFLQALREFRQSKEEADKEHRFKKCVQRLDQMPKGSSLKQRFPQEGWISALIQALPDSNPLKGVVNDLYQIARLKESPRSVRHSVVKQLSVESAADGIEPDLENVKTRVEPSGFSMLASPSSVLSRIDSDEDLNCSKEKLAEKYQQKWKALEGYLPCDIAYLKVNGLRFDKSWEPAQAKTMMTPVHSESIQLEQKEKRESLPSGSPALLSHPPISKHPKTVVWHEVSKPDEVTININQQEAQKKDDDDAQTPPEAREVSLSKSPVTWSRLHDEPADKTKKRD